MRPITTFLVASHLVLAVPLLAQDAAPRGEAWTKTLKDRSKRGTLRDRFQMVRGDSGKWNDEARLQHAPPIQRKPLKLSLDEWCDQLLGKDFKRTSDDDNWLLFRTRQLDDHDRVWIERIERQGNEFTVIVSEAVWQGRYRKNFTYYNVLGVNLGKLEPGKYQAKWIVKPLKFNRFEGAGQPRDNWPKEERPAKQKAIELSVAFTVIAAPP